MNKGNYGYPPTYGMSVDLLRDARTSNIILDATDKGKFIDITSGTFTQEITSALTLGDRWFCYVGNSGTGFITLDPYGSETIMRDGVSHVTWVLWPGEVCLISGYGGNFYYTNIQKGQSVQAVTSAVSEVIFSAGIGYRRRLSMVVENVSVSATAQLGVSLRINGVNSNRNSRFITIAGTTAPISESSGGATSYIVGADGLIAAALTNDRFVAGIEFYLGETSSSYFTFKTHFKANSTNLNSSNGITFTGDATTLCTIASVGDIRIYLSAGTIDT